MNIVIALVVGVVLIIVVGASIVSGLISIWEGLRKSVISTREYLSKSIVSMLRKWGGGGTLTLPKELEGASPLPSHDKEREALRGYDPVMRAMPTLRSQAFSPTLDVYLSAPPEPVDQIDVEDVPKKILALSSSLPYAHLLSVLSEDPKYPVAPPIKPAKIKPLPDWTPWKLSIEEPHFEMPHYKGFFSFLNGFIAKCFSEERERVEKARERRQSLIHQCDKRNLEMEGLARKAKSRFEVISSQQEKEFSKLMARYQNSAAQYENAFMEEKDRIRSWCEKVQLPGKDGLMNRLELAFKGVQLPEFIFREGRSKFDSEAGILIHEHQFPDVSSVEWVKYVSLKSGLSVKPANQREKKEAVTYLYPSLCLRLAAEIVRLDSDDLIKAVAVNGWVDYVEKATGKNKRAYCASLFATKEQILNLDLTKLDAVEAFSSLKGQAARSFEVIPIAPVLVLDMDDPRFVDAKSVLSEMASGENLAAMHWEDFEHLCRELFERAFAETGATVKITQASRDLGVDAIVFDPDPLRGGKIVIQAKRYINTVDVSAVRDLYGSVINEGAVKGILVSTSHFGPESYSFAKDKPITLINGNELLGLLEKHGYKFRINLEEARKLL